MLGVAGTDRTWTITKSRLKTTSSAVDGYRSRSRPSDRGRGGRASVLSGPCAVELYRSVFSETQTPQDARMTTQIPVPVEDVLFHMLEHDGYLVRVKATAIDSCQDCWKDWWRARHGRHFVPIGERQVMNEVASDGRNCQESTIPGS